MKTKKILLGTCSAVLLLLAFGLVMTSCTNLASSDNGMLTVSYKANGQNVTVPHSQKVAPGGTVNVAELQGYNPDTAATAFNGWNTKADASGDLYTPGYPLTVNENIILYAMWNNAAGEGSGVFYEVKMEYHDESHWVDENNQNVTTYFWRAYCVPEWLTTRRVELNNTYTAFCSFKSDIDLRFANVSLVDTYMPDVIYGTDNPYCVFDSDGMAPKGIVEANKVYNEIYYFRYEALYGWDEVKPAASSSNAEMANVLLFQVSTTNVKVAPTLRFYELTIQKDDPITLIGLTANGSHDVATSQLYLTFDKPLDYLDPVTVRIPYYEGVKILSCSGGGENWIVNVDPHYYYDQTNVLTFDITVSFTRYQKQYNILGEREVTIYTGATIAPPAPVYWFYGVTANGNITTTTTQLVLEFGNDDGLAIPGLTVNDIYITGVDGIVKGALGAAYPSGSRWRQNLAISGFARGGQITVSVSKAGLDIRRTTSSWPKTTIYRNYNDITYTGFVGRGYDLLNSPYFNKDSVKSPYILNMPRVIGEGLYVSNNDLYKSDKTGYAVGQNFGRVMKSLSTHANVGGTVGFFADSAAACYGITGFATGSVPWQKSFITSYTEIVKVREYLNIRTNDELVKGNFLDPDFVTDLRSTMSPLTFFNKWGTHVLGRVDMGGRLDMGYVYDNPGRISENSLEVYAQANAAVVTGHTVPGDDQIAAEFRGKFEREYVKSWGGSQNLTTYASAKANYNTWFNSLENPANQTIVRSGSYFNDQYNDIELIPVWYLIDWSNWAEYSRSQQLSSAYDDMLLANNQKLLKLQNPAPSIQTTYVVKLFTAVGLRMEATRANLWVQAAPNELFVVGNLNWSVKPVSEPFAPKDPYINLLGYTETTNKNVSIRDIKVVKGGSTPNSAFYINGALYHLIGNANACAGGGPDRVWLYYTYDDPKISASTSKPIRDIGLEYNRDKYFMDDPKYEDGTWETVKWTSGGAANMNSGSDGALPVYMWVWR